ncbi:MAG: lipid-binding SYLF domain-containing protein [Pseudomonadota bacterium]
MKPKLSRRAAIAGALTGCLAAAPALAGDPRNEATELVADATETALYFAADSAFEPMWDLAENAKAMVIIPEKFRAGFIIGGSAGDAVMLAKNKDGTWSQPTFLTIGSLSFGFQAGAEASEIVLLVMSEQGKAGVLGSSVKLGGDLSIAAGPIGAGAKAQTTDVLAFSRSRGLYGGVSLEGAILKTRENWNRAYYDADVSPADVVYLGEAYNPNSAPLQNAVWRLANKTAPQAAPAAMSYADESDPKTEAELDALEGGAPLKSGGFYEDDAAWNAPADGDSGQ